MLESPQLPHSTPNPMNPWISNPGYPDDQTHFSLLYRWAAMPPEPRERNPSADNHDLKVLTNNCTKKTICTSCHFVFLSREQCRPTLVLPPTRNCHRALSSKFSLELGFHWPTLTTTSEITAMCVWWSQKSHWQARRVKSNGRKSQVKLP